MAKSKHNSKKNRKSTTGAVKTKTTEVRNVEAVDAEDVETKYEAVETESEAADSKAADIQSVSAESSGLDRWRKLRYKLFRMVSVGVVDEPLNKLCDIISTVALIVNLAVTIMNTFDAMEVRYGDILSMLERITVFIFAVDYVLRIITAPDLYPEVTPGRATVKYLLSFSGIIDFLSTVPYYMPFFFPSGAAAFRMFRVVRILRLFRINAYYDSFNVITEVIKSKKQQLLSSVFIIIVLMISSSLCMYSLEHDAQPEVFKNALSGIWWSASTLLTVGYGDIYPVTELGKLLGIGITFLGCGMVAIPTGIISAGFVEQYSRLKRIGDYAVEEDIHFIKIEMKKSDSWIGKRIMDLKLPHGAIIAVIQRGQEIIVPRGDVVLCEGDKIVIGAESIKDDTPINLKEVLLRRDHPWNGVAIKDLDISRQTFIIMVKRNDRVVIPKGDLVLREGDTIILYSKVGLRMEEEISV